MSQWEMAAPNMAANPNGPTSGFRMLRVQVTHDTATARHIVAVHEEKTYPYRIENHLSTKLGFRQLGTDFVSSPTASDAEEQKPVPWTIMIMYALRER